MFQQSRNSNLNDNLLFLRRWVSDPLGVGAIMPSGRALAAALAAAIPEPGGGIVVELGGGTGSVTQALLGAGLTLQDLVVVERDPAMYRHLCRRFPEISVIRADARHVSKIIPQRVENPVVAIVSSLPLLSMAPALRFRIFRAATDLLAEGGVIVQFSYGLWPPIPASQQARLGIEPQCLGRFWWNLPPATVWTFRKRRHMAGCISHAAAARDCETQAVASQAAARSGKPFYLTNAQG